MVDRYRSLGSKMLKEPSGAYVTYADHHLIESEMENVICDLHNDVKSHAENAQHWMFRAQAYESEVERLEKSESRVRELESELEKWVLKNNESLGKVSDLKFEMEQLRASHAALVEAAEVVINRNEI